MLTLPVATRIVVTGGVHGMTRPRTHVSLGNGPSVVARLYATFAEVVRVSVDPTIAGKVVDARGDPVEGARVYFERAPVPVPDRATLTDSSGRFELWAPSPGTYQVGVASEGSEGTVHETTSVDVGELGSVDLDVRLRALR